MDMTKSAASEVNVLSDAEVFGKLIKEARDARGWSQVDVAHQAFGHSNKNQISEYENGKVPGIKIATVRTIATLLAIDPEKIPAALRWHEATTEINDRDAKILELSRGHQELAAKLNSLPPVLSSEPQANSNFSKEQNQVIQSEKGVLTFDDSKLPKIFRTQPDKKSSAYTKFSYEIPYFSRGTYLSEMKDTVQRGLVTEEDILGELVSHEFHHVFLLYGSGGIGKTRLAYDIGMSLLKDNWVVLYFRTSAEFKINAIDQLLNCNIKDQNLAIVVDYAETIPNFGELCSRAISLNEEPHGPMKVKLIANCRSSGFRRAKLSLKTSGVDGRQVKAFDLDAGFSNLAKSHLVWISNKILEKYFGDKATYYSQVVSGIPAMAAHVAFVFEKRNQASQERNEQQIENYDRALKNLAGFETFSEWAEAKLAATYASSSTNDEIPWGKIATTFALMPFEEGLKDQIFEDEFSIEPLLDDNWVVSRYPHNSESTSAFHATHDVFSDVSLQLWGKDADTVSREKKNRIEIGWCLDAGVKHDLVANVIRNFNRVQHKGLSNRIKLALGELVNDQSFLVLPRHQKLALVEAEFLDQSTKSKIVRSLLISDEGKANSAELLLGWLAPTRFDEKPIDDETREQVLSELTSEIKHNTSSNQNLRFAFGVAPSHFEGIVLDRIEKENESEQTSYLLRAWLKNKSTKDRAVEIWPFVERWLQANGTLRVACNLIQEWIDATNSTDSITTYVKAWVNAENDGKSNCFFSKADMVFSRWLRHGGDPKIVESAISKWLSIYGRSQNAISVKYEWLNSGGNRGLLAEFAPIDLGDLIAEVRSPYYAQKNLDWTNYIKAEFPRKKEEVISVFENWKSNKDLNTHISAQNVYSAWLQSTKNIDSISVVLREYLDANLKIAEDGFGNGVSSILFRNLLKQARKSTDFNKEIEPWCEYIEAWMNSFDFSNNIDSQPFLAECLRVKFLSELSETSTWTWLGNKTHARSSDAAHLFEHLPSLGYSQWDEPKKTEFAKLLENWFGSNPHERKAFRVLRGAFLTGEATKFLKQMTSWFDEFGQDAELQDRRLALLKVWSSKDRENGNLLGYVQNYIASHFGKDKKLLDNEKALATIWRNNTPQLKSAFFETLENRITKVTDDQISLRLCLVWARSNEPMNKIVSKLLLALDSWDGNVMEQKDSVFLIRKLLQKESADVQLKEFLDVWITTFEPEGSEEELHLIESWRKAQRPVAEIAAILDVCAAKRVSLENPAKMKRTAPLWNEYLIQTDQQNTPAGAWIAELLVKSNAA
jgi:transcriptional regulator with XRE-family HTH domain